MVNFHVLCVEFKSQALNSVHVNYLYIEMNSGTCTVAKENKTICMELWKNVSSSWT